MQRSGDCQHVRAAQKRSRQWRAPDVYSGPDFLDADMTPADIVDILMRLKFHDGKATVELDRAARDYLVSAVATRCGGK